MSPERPRIAGELRLRVTSSDDPASFESGFGPLANRWSRPLCALSKYYLPFYEKLREERLVPDDLDRVLLTLPAARLIYSKSHILYTLNDTFIVDFGTHKPTFSVITEQGVEVLKLPFFLDFRRTQRRTPYTGAYTNHPSFNTPMYWLFCRKCLGSTWTFNAPRPWRYKVRCVALSQDNHTCEMCYSPIRWISMLPKRRRALLR